MGLSRSKLICVILFLICVIGAGFSFSAEPYFITVEKLELKKSSGEWIKIIEPDHKVDLMSAEATVTFFNNGRIPEADFDNFRVTFDDHGLKKQIWRKLDYADAVSVKKGSFVRVAFDLDFESAESSLTVRPRAVKELRLTVDDAERIDDSQKLNMI